MQFQFNSLKARLTFWFLTVTILSLTTLVTILYLQQASAIRDEEFTKLQVVRDLKVMQLSKWLDERMGDLNVATGDHEIQFLENISMEDAGESDPSTFAAVRRLLQRYLDYYDAYHELFIISGSSGKVVISTNPALEGADKMKDPYFTEPLRLRQSYIKDIYYSETERRPAMTVSTPIFCQNHDEEHIIGVLVARINLAQSFYPFLQERTGMGETGETLIVNKDALALNDLRWHEDATLKLRISAAPAVRAAQGETGIVETADYRGVQVLAAYTHIPQTGWGFVAKRDLAEVYAPIRTMLIRMVSVATIVILLVIVVSLLIARSISSPVKDLTRASRRMASGEEGVRVDIRTDDEIEVLGTAFNQMALRLDAARQESMAQDWLKTGITELDDVIRGEKELSRLCTDIITALARRLNVQVGTLSLADHENAQLTLEGSYAYKEKPGVATTFRFGEGLVGQAAREKKKILINDGSIEHITVTSALGELAPRNVLCVPLLHEGDVVGVIELGSLHAFTDLQLRFVEQTAERLAIAIHVAKARKALQTLHEESQAQAEELQAQAEGSRES